MKQKLILLILCVFGHSNSHFLAAKSKFNSESIEYGRKLQSPRVIEDVDLQTVEGTPFSKAQLKGQWSMITFGFTNCPDVCPTALAAFRDELKLLEEEEAGVQFVFVTVDPERHS